MADTVPTPNTGDWWEFRFAEKRAVYIHDRVTNGRGVEFVVAEYERTGEVFTTVLTQFRETYRLQTAAVPS